MKKHWNALILALLIAFSATACAQTPAPAEPPAAPAAPTDILTELGLTKEEKDATDYTVQINSAIYSLLDFEDTSEYDNAVRGLIDAPEVLELKESTKKEDAAGMYRSV